MNKPRLLCAVCACVFSFIVTTSHAALFSRLAGQAYYDDVLDITWTADADINGLMTWADANTWVDNLTVSGVGGWRLPDMDVDGNGSVTDCATASAADCEDNEMGYMFFHNGVSESNPAPFTDVSLAFYWSETIYQADPLRVWLSEFSGGFMCADGRDTDTFAAWAVHSGDIGAVPLPASFILFASGLLGLLGIARSRTSS